MPDSTVRRHKWWKQGKNANIDREQVVLCHHSADQDPKWHEILHSIEPKI